MNQAELSYIYTSVRARDLTAWALASAAMSVAVLAIGGAPRWAACVAAAMSVVAAAPYVTSRRQFSMLEPMLGFLIVAVGWTALQVVPLPATVVGWLSPARLQLAIDNAAAFGAKPPAFLALSYDPPATLVEVAKLVGYVCLWIACARVASSPVGRRRLGKSVAALGVGLAVIALVHEATGATRVFGLYAPEASARLILSPLINENHISSLLAATTPLALAAAVTSAGRERVLWTLSVFVTSAVVLLSQSRAGIGGLAIGLVLAAALLYARHRRPAALPDRGYKLGVVVPIGVILLCMVVLLGALTLSGVAAEFAGTSRQELTSPNSKFALWRSSASLIADVPWTGIGRGSFEFASTMIHPAPGKTFARLENEYLQAVVDWGIPVALVLAILLISVAVRARRHWREGPLPCGAIAGLVALLATNLVGFSLELTSVAMVAVAMVAVVLPAQAVPRTARRRPELLRAAGLLCAGAVVALAGSSLGREARVSAAALGSALSTLESSDEVAALGHAASLQHPADYMVAALAARELARRRDTRSIALTNRALTLHRRHPGLHLLAARLLATTNRPKQALAEYRLALVNSANPKAVLYELTSKFSAQDSAAAIPTDAPQTARMLSLLEILKQAEVVAAVGERMLAEQSDNATVLSVAAEITMRHGGVESALRFAREVVRIRNDHRAKVILVRALVQARQLDEAQEVTAMLVADKGLTLSRKITVLELAADVSMRSGRFAEAKTRLEQARELVRGDDVVQARIHRAMSRIEAKLGNQHRADWEMQRARELERR